MLLGSRLGSSRLCSMTVQLFYRSMSPGATWILLCSLYVLVASESHYFASVEKMKSLVNKEKEVIPVLRNLQQTLLHVNRLIDGYLDETEQLPNKAPEILTKDPLFNFQLLRRFVVDLHKIIELLNVTIVEPDFEFPEKEELKSASIQLLRLQNLYDLKVKDLIKGSLKEDLKSFIQLSTIDAILMSRLENPLSHEWKQMTLKKLFNEIYSMDEEELQWKMLRVKNVINDLEIFSEDVDDEHKSTNSSNEENEEETEEEIVEDLLDFSSRFKNLCNGINMKTPREEKDLTCELVTNRYPYFSLRPIKMEILSKSPPIMMFYDVLTTEETETLKSLAEPELRRSLVENEDDPYYRRTSHTMWLDAIDDPIVNTVSHKATWFSGLICPDIDEDCESLQMVNYGIGGEYYLHLDESVNEEIEMDVIYDLRMATFMFYLNDVEFGGRTVFPLSRVSATPKKGSAILWYNLFPNGSVDERTRHGGCPVLYGSKWIATKWIGDKSQMLIRPCDLQEHSEAMNSDFLNIGTRKKNRAKV